MKYWKHIQFLTYQRTCHQKYWSCSVQSINNWLQRLYYFLGFKRTVNTDLGSLKTRKKYPIFYFTHIRWCRLIDTWSGRWSHRIVRSWLCLLNKYIRRLIMIAFVYLYVYLIWICWSKVQYLYTQYNFWVVCLLKRRKCWIIH